MTQLYQSKIFANGSTTLPKPVQIFKIPSEKANEDEPALHDALDAAEKVTDDRMLLCNLVFHFEALPQQCRSFHNQILGNF